MLIFILWGHFSWSFTPQDFSETGIEIINRVQNLILENNAMENGLMQLIVCGNKVDKNKKSSVNLELIVKII